LSLTSWEELLKAGVMKELNPEYLVVHQRKPSTYAGHPFIVEMAMAYGGNIPKRGNFVVYRFANKIPLLYDEASDVSYKCYLGDELAALQSHT
jgi:DNA topoisomerase-6 subunit B